MPVTEPGYRGAVESETPGAIVEDNEIVSRAVHFCELNIHSSGRVDRKESDSQSRLLEIDFDGAQPLIQNALRHGPLRIRIRRISIVGNRWHGS